MARFAAVMLAYFLIGAVMWGGGVITWNETGIGGMIIEDTANGVSVNENTSQTLEQSGGPIRQAAATMGGPILAIWNFIVQFIGFLFWPVTVLQSVSAPPRAVVTAGGALTVMFLGAVIRLIRRSA
jgi:hypothetical protein